MAPRLKFEVLFLLQFVLRYKIWLVIAVAIGLRMAVFLAFPSIFAFDQTSEIHGSLAYDQYAVNLNGTGVFGLNAGEPDAMLPPFYSYTLAALYGVFGRSSLVVAIFHTVLDAVSIWLLIDIGKRLFKSYDATLWDERIGLWIGLIAGLCFAFYPYLIFQNLTLIDTAIFITQLHLFVWLIILLREQESLNRKTMGFAVTAGVVLGITLLTRPIMPIFALFLPIWYLFRLSLIQSFLRLLIVAVVGALVLMPWIGRNYAVFDDFVPMTTTSGSNLWQGNSEYTIPVFRAGYDVQWTAPEVNAPRESREADAERFALVMQFWQENSEKIPELLWVKFWVHWSIDIAPRYNPQAGEQFALNEDGEFIILRDGESTDGFVEHGTYDEPIFEVIGRNIHRVYFGGLFILAVIGSVISWRLWRDISLIWFLQISMTIVYMVFHPSTRYRAPTDPTLFLFSVYTLAAIFLWWMGRRNEITSTLQMPEQPKTQNL